MSTDKRDVYVFGPFQLFPAERRLEKDGQPVRMSGRAFDLLSTLVRQAGEIVPSRRLLEDVWQGLTVEESSLRAHIKTLRKALGEYQPETEYVTNVPGRGYCFVAPVDRIELTAPRGAQSDTRAGLPGRAAAVIGRSDSIAAVCRELSRNRLVTVTGPAGVGKTTVAIAAAEAMRDDNQGPVCFVDLAPVHAPSLVVSALSAGPSDRRRGDRSAPASRSVPAGQTTAGLAR